jgi:hypothetical protein
MAESARQFEPTITVTGCNTDSEIGAQSTICAKMPDTSVRRRIAAEVEPAACAIG